MGRYGELGGRYGERMGGALVTEIHIYPVKGEAGRDLSVAEVGPEGLSRRLRGGAHPRHRERGRRSRDVRLTGEPRTS